MSPAAPSSGQQPPNPTGDEMPTRDELFEIGAKSLQTGALTGVMGAAFGAGSGIMRAAPPGLFALVAGIQWFALGSSFMASRSLLWHAWGGEEYLTSADKVKAGAAAGGVSGMIGGMARGPRNILPGILFFSTLAGGATYMSQKLQSTVPKEKKSIMASKWSPMRQISDQEYEKILVDKMLRIDAELAILSDNIAALKRQSSPSSSASPEAGGSKPASETGKAAPPSSDTQQPEKARPRWFSWGGGSS
ncbi:hypothetical protein PG994_003669 [Apiospora phragmitis]|uniref:Uncharacterized protein n=1 Tax=Apiospora phragmitis TaxID=2905665 RepID=A0ABR1VYS9_9PEZI